MPNASNFHRSIRLFNDLWNMSCTQAYLSCPLSTFRCIYGPFTIPKTSASKINSLNFCIYQLFRCSSSNYRSIIVCTLMCTYKLMVFKKKFTFKITNAKFIFLYIFHFKATCSSSSSSWCYCWLQ